MVQKIVSSETLKLLIKYVLKQVQHLSTKEQKEVINYTLRNIKNLKTIISLSSGKLKHKHSLFSKCIAKCKNSDGFYRFVIRRREHISKPTTNLDEAKSYDISYNFSDEELRSCKSEDDIQENKSFESVPDLNATDSLKEICNFDLHCSLCTDISNNYTVLTSHVLSHRGTAITCYKCKQTFNNISIYKIHLNEDCLNCIGMKSDKFLQHLTNVVKKYGQKYQLVCFCPFCGKSFAKPFNLKRHLKNICGDNYIEAEYQCFTCNKKFDHEVKYSEHLQQHSNYKCLNCDLYFSSKKLLKIHSHSHPKISKKYKCDLCNLQFQNRSQIREHNKIHINDKQLTPADKQWRVWCNVCHISFFDYFTYKRHCTRKKHLSKVTDDKELLNMKTFMCVKCGQVFMTKDALSTHCSRIHSDRAKLSCNKCPYTTSSKTNLKRHALIHESNVPKNFFCDQCPKSFPTSSALKEHVISVHTEERSFACDVCPKTFKLKNLLNRHKKIHSPALPFVCAICTVGFKRNSHLTRHTETRHKELLPKLLPDSTMKKDNIQTIIQSTLGEPSKMMEPPLPLTIDMKEMTENIAIDRVFSLIDAQSGELVTLSATELSKNAVINMSGGELLNDVHISELWNPPSTMYNLDPILQSNVLPQPEFDIITGDKNEITHMIQKTLEESTTDKNTVQYCIVPPENVESQENNELRYFYV